MKTVKTQGRYEAPPYVQVIKKLFEDNFPDNVPKDFVIDHVLKYFWKYVEEELKADKEVSVFSYGKFKLRESNSRTTGKPQYYPKFKWSKHFILRLREFKGTATEAELRDLEKKRDFMRSIWEKRKAYMLERREKLPEKLQGYD